METIKKGGLTNQKNEQGIKERFRFERDTKRYHRFKVEFDQDLTSTIKISKY